MHLRQRDNQKTRCQLPVLGSQFVRRKPVSRNLRNLTGAGIRLYSLVSWENRSVDAQSEETDNVKAFRTEHL
jgi:hypothetical protein